LAILTDRFSRALLLAFELHRSQRRKGSDIPYYAHLLEVTAIVLEDGGDEDQAIAALLHDAVEDQGGLPTLNRIRSEFGERVAGIVEGCSDSTSVFKPPWRFRKEEYLRKLPSHPPEVLLVSLADKVHNARTIFVALQRQGDGVWERFNGGKAGTIWYYRALTQAYEGLVDPFRLDELKRLVGEIEKITGLADE